MTTQIALALIATTLIGISLLTWATIHYVPLVLYGDDHGGGSSPEEGRPS